VHTSTWPGGAAHAVCSDGYRGASRGANDARETLSRSLRGVSWMMSWRRRVETPVGGPVSSVHGRHTGVSASALLTEHGLGKCTGCRAGCQMWPASGRPLVSLSLVTPLLRRAAATTGIAQRRSARRVVCGGSGPPSSWPNGQRMCVEEEVCVESSSLRKNFESVSQTSVNGIEIDATRTLRTAL
jgi:hypothetical protein